MVVAHRLPPRARGGGSLARGRALSWSLLLILLDIDGTLLRGGPRAHTDALVSAMREVFGVPARAADVAATRPAGRTDQEIVRRVLRAHGVAPAAVGAGLPAAMRAAAAAYPAYEADDPPRAFPGAAEALGRLRSAGTTPALLTGNLEAIAHAKMARVGLGGFFARGEGAYGSDHERRDALVPIARARARAAGRCAEPAVVVGDTPRDVRCARAGGARCVAVATGADPAADLERAGADAVVADLAGAVDVVLGWAGAAPALRLRPAPG